MSRSLGRLGWRFAIGDEFQSAEHGAGRVGSHKWSLRQLHRFVKGTGYKNENNNMNGNFTVSVLWIVNFLLFVVMGLIGFIVNLHLKSDSEHRKEVWDELQRHRNRLHDIMEDISKWKVETLRDRQ